MQSISRAKVVGAALAASAVVVFAIGLRTATAKTVSAGPESFTAICEELHAAQDLDKCRKAFAECTEGDTSRTAECRKKFTARDYWCDEAFAHWQLSR